jgi:hypothetical protein
MPHPIKKKTNSSLSRLRSSERIVPSTNMEPKFPTFGNAHHILILSGCSGLPAENLGFSEASPKGNVLQRRTMWHSRLSEYPPVTLRTPKQKRNVSRFRLPTMAASTKFRTKTTAIRRDRFAINLWPRPQYILQSVAHLNFLLLPPVLNRRLPYEQMLYVNASLYVNGPHFLFHQSALQSHRQGLSMVQHQQKTLDNVVCSQHYKIHTNIKRFW